MAKGGRKINDQRREVREMRDAETILGIIRERGSKGLPLEDVYRQLFNPALYLQAYGKLYRNKGAMTPGMTEETVDGMSLEKIQTIIEAIKQERYRWMPARRIYIEKKNSIKKRPLGLPVWSDKVLQEVIRVILEAYYEPQFSDRSHGFRPERGCHTALREIYRIWAGTTWFIEGDISAYFDSIDHTVLLTTMRKKIHDNRFIRLIDNLLRAGYLEDWRFNKTLSGTPQGGVVSPILANIYLNELDEFVTSILIPANNRGTIRQRNLAHNRLTAKVSMLRKHGQRKEAQALSRVARATPSVDPDDPSYRRLRYIRYADDFLVGFTGPRAEAEEIKRQIGEYLQATLRLELSEPKTLLTHASTEAAHFLGYDISINRDSRKRGANRKRSFSGQVTLRIPRDVIQAKCKPYTSGGKPIHRIEQLHNDALSIMMQFQTEYRGLVNYYQMATNLRDLNRLKWTMETSMTKTLAHKLKISVAEVYRRFHATIETPQGPQRGLQAVKPRIGKKPLVATWGGIRLIRKVNAPLDDNPPRIWNHRTEVVQRLLADTCELCGSQERTQVHHIRALRDLKRWGRSERPPWVVTMAARQRKTLVVCFNCHYHVIHGHGTAGNVVARRTRI
jgi:group II intron reverse transcriptase/maturase